MAGCKSGVAKSITALESRALFTHCYGHSLNLAVGDTIKGVKLLANVLDMVFEMSGLIKFSPKRNAQFDILKQQLAPGSPGFRVLCPTRWTVRSLSLKSVLDNYTVLQELWDECLDGQLQSDLRARIIGVQSQLKLFSFFYGLNLAHLILKHTDNLSSTLQSKDMSAAEGQTIVSMTVQVLKSLRSDDSFSTFWDNIILKSQDVDVGEPLLPRKRKRPQRYDDGLSSSYHPDTAKDHFILIYLEALDLSLNCIEQRFDQPGYKMYDKLEQLLFKAANCEDYGGILADVTEFYGTDFDAVRLETQLELLGINFTYNKDQSQNEKVKLKDIITYFKSLTVCQRSLYSEVVTLLKIIMVMPATNAESERSFSTLRRVKTYLRSTMSQERLNHCMLLNVYKEETDDIDLVDIAKSFVCSERRLSVFGKF